MEKTYPRSVSGVCEFIWDIEEEFDLFEQTENGIYFWQLIRFKVYYALMQNIGIFAPAHPKPSINIKYVAKTLLNGFSSLTIKNPFFLNAEKENVVIPHQRQVNGIDIYTEEVIKSLSVDNCLILNRNWESHSHPYAHNMGCAYITSMINGWFRNGLRKLGLGGYSKEFHSTVKKIEEHIHLCFNIDMRLPHIALTSLQFYETTYALYRKLFLRLKTKTLYLTTGYTQFSAIAAAQSLGINVIELQHGTFTRYHLGYSYPTQNKCIPYFANEIRCFGHFWPETTPLPIKTEVKITGAPYIEKLSPNQKQKVTKPKTIVFSSQGVISQYLYEFALKVAALIPEYEIIYRLHPSENEQDFIPVKNLKNFKISTRNPNIFELLKTTEYQAGVFSTTLLEGLALGCKTIVINMPGIEYMYPVIEKGDALCVDTPEEFVEKINDAVMSTNMNYYYADINETMSTG